MTKIKLGDKVRFVNENMQGVVTNIKGNTAGVTIEDDFEIPVLLSEIVKITSIEEKPADQKSPTQKPAFVQLHTGIHAAFDKISETVYELKIHNSEVAWLMLAVYVFQNNKYQLLQHNVIELENTVSITKLNTEDFNQWNHLQFQMMFVEHEHHNKLKNQLIKTLKISQKEFFAAYKNCYFLGHQAICFRLDDTASHIDLQKLKTKDFSEPVSQTLQANSLPQAPGQIIDLHAEQLIKDPKTLSASAILDAQMDAIQKALEAAYLNKVPQLTFIHGVGNHFLKNKLKNYLAMNKQWVKEFKDADPLKFGGGATDVFLH